MDNYLYIDSIASLHNEVGGKPKHPLITIVDFRVMDPPDNSNTKVLCGGFAIIFKNNNECIWKYGRNKYDFQEGTLVFISPGQVLEIEYESFSKENADLGIFFHPDLLSGTNLDLNSPKYSFFSYDVHEALHISDQEKKILYDQIKNLEMELSSKIDKNSKSIIVSYLELILNYCIRFYDRQFFTRCHQNSDIISRFESLLLNYYNKNEIEEKGIPTVSYCAEKLNLSSGYLSDILKKETGKTALEHIHKHLIDKAKHLLLSPGINISEVAFQLGFEYPQHFTKLFKKHTGLSPKMFKSTN